MDLLGSGDKLVPSLAAGIDDGLVGCEDPVGKVIVSKKFPDVFDWIKFRRVKWQAQQPDIVRHHQALAGLMPTRAVQCHDSESARADPAADFLQMQVHGLGIGVRQHQTRPDTACRADSAEQGGTFVALIAQRGGSAAALRPDAGQAAFLPNARFVLPPQFDGLAFRGRGDDGGNQIGKVFLRASCAAASA